MIKKILLFFLCCMLFLIIVGTILMYTAPVFSTTARGFLNGIAYERYERAYVLLSIEHRKRVPYEQFIADINAADLVNYQSSQWQEPQQEGTNATLIGYITLKNGKKIPAKFYFIYERDKWFIDRIALNPR